jgi:hypothetical protein
MSKADVVPDLNGTDALVVTRAPGGVSFLERWIQGEAPEKALERVDAMTAVLERLRLAAIKQTYPEDWVIHVSRDADGVVTKQVGYLQDSGAERAGKIFGVVVREPVIAREDLPDGTYVYKLQAEALSQVTHECIETCFGSRWSGDLFFTRQLKDDDDKVDPTDVMKAAYANLHGRAVRALSGLTSVPLGALTAAGIDTSRCSFVGYAKGERGGTSTGASLGTPDLVVGFGNAKGTKVTGLTDKDLDWYIGAAERSIADPDRARFKKSNEQLLAACTAEKMRRFDAKAQEEAGGSAAPAASEPGTPTTRGGKIAALNTRLGEAAKDKRKVLPLLRTVTKDLFEKELGSFQDLTEEQLDKLLTVDATMLGQLQAQLDKAVTP